VWHYRFPTHDDQLNGYQKNWGKATYIVPVGVNRLCIKTFLALLFTLFYVFAHPNVTVQPKNEVYTAGQANEMRFQSTHKNRRDSDQLPVPKLGKL